MIPNTDTSDNDELLENENSSELAASSSPVTCRQSINHNAKKKQTKLTQIKTVVDQLQGIAETINNPIEENEFDVFGKNVGLQLKTMPLKLALEAQQHIQSYLSQIRLQQISVRSTCWQTISTPSSCSDTLTSAMSPTENINLPILYCKYIQQTDSE